MYDAVIIGTDISGLVCRCYLAKAGKMGRHEHLILVN
jgi:phytoene dehydrogenase-like protein